MWLKGHLGNYPLINLILRVIEMVLPREEETHNDPIRIVETLTVDERSRGRPKLTWDERIRHDLLDLHLSDDIIGDRSSWRHGLRLWTFRILGYTFYVP